MKLNQKGVVDLMFVAVLVVLVAAAAFTFWKVNQTDETVSDTEQATAESTANFVTTQDARDGESNSEQPVETSDKNNQQTLGNLARYQIPEGWAVRNCGSDFAAITKTEDSLPLCNTGQIYIFSISIEELEGDFSCSTVGYNDYENRTCEQSVKNGRDFIAINLFTEHNDHLGGYSEQDIGLFLFEDMIVSVLYLQLDKEKTYQEEFQSLLQSISEV